MEDGNRFVLEAMDLSPRDRAEVVRVTEAAEKMAGMLGARFKLDARKLTGYRRDPMPEPVE